MPRNHGQLFVGEITDLLDHIHIRILFFSAVYYLKSDDNGSGRLFFNNPTGLMIYPNKSELNFTCHYAPVEKRLIIFPSNLEHSVEDYNGVQNRYSISYDLTVVADNRTREG